MSDQQELFRAPHEDTRPKDKDPTNVTVKERTAAPVPTPKKRSRVTGHQFDATYLQPQGFGGRVMLLDSIVLAVRLEDPFSNAGRYPIEMGFEEFAAGHWVSANPDQVVSEYERLAIMLPDFDDNKRYSEQIKGRCTHAHLQARYKALLKDARAKIEAELERLTLQPMEGTCVICEGI